MSLGKGVIISASNKRKVQGRRSTDNKLIGVHNTLPQVLWTTYFIEAQGYQVDHNEVYQDNKSAQLLETNGHFFLRKRNETHQASIYVFAKDKVDKGDIDIVPSPADTSFPEDQYGTMYSLSQRVAGYS